MLPVALGLAMKLNGSPVTLPSAPTGLDVQTMTPAATIAADKAIPRIGLDAPASELDQNWEKPAPNQSSLPGCPWFGAEKSDKITNQRKNRTDLPSGYHAVEFSALTDLDWPHEATTRRDKWTSDQLAQIAPFEGEAITVTGFVVAFRPQGKSGESPNCGEKGEPNTDWHIALVGEFGDKEPEAMVVETTPRIKQHHPNWVPAALESLKGTEDSVRVSGYLLLDPVHKGHLGKYRRTLWEIHPIHRIEVFKKSELVWRDIDDQS